MLTSRTPVLVDLPEDHGTRPHVGSEVWYFTGFLRSGERELWLQSSTINVSQPDPAVHSWTAIRDDARGISAHATNRFARSDADFGTDRLHIETPGVRVDGDLDGIASTGDPRARIHGSLHAF